MNIPANIIALADVDDSLCHTKAKFEKKVGAVDVAGTPCVFDGEKPVSWRSRKQTALANLLLGAAREVVPVTGRTVDKLKAVKVGFGGHAICSFGAVILTPDGQVEPHWHALMSERARQQVDALERIVRGAQSAAASTPKLSVQRVADQGLDLFVKVQDKDPKAAGMGLVEMGRLLNDIVPPGWTVHENENQLCAYPPYLGKRDAVLYYLEHLAGAVELLIGVGDSKSDLDFLGLCDFVIVPQNSQLFVSLGS